MGKYTLTKKRVLKLLVISAFFLMIATAGLGVAGVLETTERGDIQYLSTERFVDGTAVTAPSEGRQFVVENPTDANAFYNAVVRVQNGGPVINRGVSITEGIMSFHYHPITYHLFALLSIFGYASFKFGLLIISILATVSGTALLLLAERDLVDVSVSNNSIAILALATIGVGPILSNLKTGQMAPIMYFFISLFWWGYRTNRLSISGLAITITAFLNHILSLRLR